MADVSELTEVPMATDGAAPLDADVDDVATFTDDELAALALAVERDPEVDADGPSLWELSEPQTVALLGSWYLPTAHAGTRRLRGWRRQAALVAVVAFVGIDAVGLCATYGPIFHG